METISNVVSSVSGTVTKAIYGDQTANNETAGNEPVSGVQGEGTTTEPYDKGNSEDPTNPTTSNETAGKEPVSGLEGKGTATEPFDQGNSADATNITSLPIREKPTVPTTDTFNSATAANASTAAHTSSITPQETLGGETRGGETLGGGDADATDTKNLSDTLSKTEAPKSLSTVDGTPQTPGLAGFGDKPSIDPYDQTQVPTVVTGVSGGSSAPTDTLGGGDAGVTDTKNLSETLSKTTDPTSTTTGNEGKHDAPFTGTGSANAQQAPTPFAAPVDVPTSTETKGDGSAAKEAERVVEGTHKNETSPSIPAKAEKEESPSGEKEKVSKREKLKEVLHIGHKH